MTTEEGTHILPDGTELYTKTWKPAGEPFAVLIHIHGFSDHCNRYADLFPTLRDTGILVHSFDQRGWGRSVKKPADKGLTGPTSQVLDDITSFIRAHLPSPAPLFLMGHSMGGGEILQYAAVGPVDVKTQITGFIGSAPFIRVGPGSEPNKLTVIVGRLASKVLPHHQLVQKLNSSYMCHDAAMCKDWENDPLCHDTGTLEGLTGMLDRAEQLDKGKVVIEDRDGLHLFIAHGIDDKVTSHEASKSFIERSPVKDKTLQLYDGSYHCIHLEPDIKQKYFADLVEWITSRSKLQGQSTATTAEAQSKL